MRKAIRTILAATAVAFKNHPRSATGEGRGPQRGKGEGLIAALAALLIFTSPYSSAAASTSLARDGRGTEGEGTASAASAKSATDFNLPAQPLADSLRAVAGQTNSNILFDRNLVQGISAKPLKAQLSVEEALRALLKGTGLTYRNSDDKTVMIVSERASASSTTSVTQVGAIQLAQAEGQNQSSQTTEENQERTNEVGSESGSNETSDSSQKGIPEILVVGRRTLNADIRRTEDDAQPYVIYSGDEVRQSGAQSVEEFFRARLPMNAVSPSSAGGSLQNRTTIGQLNLRGLGTNQTLILIDGRRVPGVASGDSFGQPNINGIPPSAIERIEILPSTASGAYGGGATGGVINIILKRDFSGLDVQTLYGNTFDSDVSRAQVSATGGFTLEQGRTRVMLSASHAEQNELLAADRNFGRHAFDTLVRNVPAAAANLAYGPTPNVISSTGANLVLDAAYGGSSLNSPWTYVPTGYSGPASDNAAALLGNAGQLQVTARPGSLYGGPTQDSIALDIRRDLTRNLEGYVSLYWDRNVSDFTTPQSRQVSLLANDPNNPFQQNILVNLSLDQSGFYTMQRNEWESRRANVGLIARLPFGWSSAFDFGWSQNETPFEITSTFGPTPSGTTALQVAALTDIGAHPIANIESLFNIQHQSVTQVNTLEDISLRVSGPLIDIPGGAVTLSGLLEHRREHADDFILELVTPPGAPSYSWTPDAAQEVTSAYLELRAPILSAGNAVPLVHELELMAAARRDEYDTRWAAQGLSVAGPDGPFPAPTYSATSLESSDYTLGLRYAPIQDITFRASYGTGFLPPALSQLKTALPANVLTTPTLVTTDPRRNGEHLLGDPNSSPSGRLEQFSGGDPNLQPEQSESLSYGLVFTTRFVDGLRLSVDFTEIRKTDEISNQGVQFFLDNETIYPDRIVRAPLTAADITAGFTSGRVISVNTTSINLFRTEVRAIDFQFDYSRETTHWGDWRFYLIGTKQRLFDRQTSPTIAPVNRVGFNDGFLEWQGNTGINWSAGPWTLGWNAQYLDGYSLCNSTQTAATCAAGLAVRAQGANEIPSQTYHDAFVRYSFDDALSPLLANTEVALGVQNVFDEEPPILASSGGVSGYGDPRLRRFTLSVRKHFGG